MSLVTTEEMLKKADQNGYAIGAFNVENMEMVMAVIKAKNENTIETEFEFSNLDKVLEEDGIQIRLFGKPEIKGHRRYGVILATADNVEEALAKVERAYKKLSVSKNVSLI